MAKRKIVDKVGFPGSPTLFYTWARQYDNEHRPAISCWTLRDNPTPDAPRVDITVQRMPSREEIGLSVIATAGGHSHVIVWADPDGWPALQPLWQDLHEYIIQHVEPPKDEAQRKSTGSKGLACNIWLDHMVDVKRWPLGAGPENNLLFEIWKELWAVEHHADPDEVLTDGAWASYIKGYKGRHRGKK